jgi:methionine synthase II (cobalamin-independent)
LFATLHGGLPSPPGEDPGRDLASAIAAAVRAQAAAGLDPVTDGDFAGDAFPPSGPGPWEAPDLVTAWRRAAGAGSELEPPRSAKIRLLGPYSLARLLAADPSAAGNLAEELSEALNARLRDLAEAGCPLVQVDEPDLVRVGDDDAERRRFTAAQARLLDGVGAHAMLAIVGGNANAAGASTIFDAPYASLLVDLIAGPDNWNLVRQAPADRGIVCGVVPTDADRRVDLPVIVWAAGYAASANGRGIDRVGLSTAGSMAALPWDEAERRMRLLAAGADVAAADPETRARRLDPRALARSRQNLGPARPTPPPDSFGRMPRGVSDRGRDGEDG